MKHRVLEKNKITGHSKPLNHVRVILLAYHEFDLRSKAVFLRKTGENLYDILVDKAVGEAFSYVV